MIFHTVFNRVLSYVISETYEQHGEPNNAVLYYAKLLFPSSRFHETLLDPIIRPFFLFREPNDNDSYLFLSIRAMYPFILFSSLHFCIVPFVSLFFSPFTFYFLFVRFRRGTVPFVLLCPFVRALEPTFFVTIESKLSRSYHFHLSNSFYCAIV